MPGIFTAAGDHKNLGLTWAPYPQNSKDHPKVPVQDHVPLTDATTLKSWLVLAAVTPPNKQIGVSLVMEDPSLSLAHAKQVDLSHFLTLLM